MFMEVNGLLTLDREGTILELMERDGYRCMFPGCELPFEEGYSDRHRLSLDHIYPQVRAREDNWPYEKINATENLQLMGASCNAKKGDAVYLEDGTLDLRVVDRPVKLPRPEACNECMNGRQLKEFEICEYCGSEPQPLSHPKWAEKTPKECSHGWTNPRDFCWMCTVGHIERAPASRTTFGVFGDN